jgi:hypothetical protein
VIAKDMGTGFFFNYSDLAIATMESVNPSVERARAETICCSSDCKVSTSKLDILLMPKATIHHSCLDGMQMVADS